MAGRHALDVAAQPVDVRASEPYLSTAYLQGYISDELRDVLPDADRLVPYVLMGSCVLGVYPRTFTRKLWSAQVAHDPATLKSLPEVQAALILGVGVVAGVLQEHPGGYSIPSENVRSQMEHLFGLYCEVGVDYMSRS